MNKVKVVTGYIPIAGHPRGPAEYGALGEKLKELKAPVQPFYAAITSTWLYQMIERLPFTPVWAISDNAQKNTLPYHCVNHQKFQWLYDATRMDEDSDYFVWIDYGICHVTGIDPAVINDFLDRVKRKPRRHVIAVPGCWPIGQIDDEHPCWRFCGGLMVMPRELVQPLKNLVQAMALLHVGATKKITFEVNTLARVEQTGKLPLQWYKADHDRSMLENY